MIALLIKRLYHSQCYVHFVRPRIIPIYNIVSFIRLVMPKYLYLRKLYMPLASCCYLDLVFLSNTPHFLTGVTKSSCNDFFIEIAPRLYIARMPLMLDLSGRWT